MKRAVCKIDENGITGTVCFSQTDPDSPVRIRFDLQGFDTVHYAVHIHEYGDTRDGCASLGGHWNPDGTNHGSVGWTKERHVGDLMNNLSPRQGRVADKVIHDSSITLYGEKSIIGRSVVIHQSSDDMGLCGIPLYVDGSTKPPPVFLYRDMTRQDLSTIIQDRQLTDDPKVIRGNRADMIRFLEKGSRTTGNAGKRLACGIIGHAK